LSLGDEVGPFARPKRTRPLEDGLHDVTFDVDTPVSEKGYFLFNITSGQVVHGSRVDLELFHRVLVEVGPAANDQRTIVAVLSSRLANILPEHPDSNFGVTLTMPREWNVWNVTFSMRQIIPPWLIPHVKYIQVQLRGQDFCESDQLAYRKFFPNLEYISFIDAPRSVEFPGVDDGFSTTIPFKNLVAARCMTGSLKGWLRFDDDGLVLVPTDPHAHFDFDVVSRIARGAVNCTEIKLGDVACMLTNNKIHPATFRSAFSEQIDALPSLPGKATISELSEQGSQQLRQYIHEFVPKRICDAIRLLCFSQCNEFVLAREFVDWVSDTFSARLLFDLPQDPELASECARDIEIAYKPFYIVITDESLARKYKLVLERY
tara:strand:+ start:98 stop:1225 length:1128 start_codon:yes stop_codon:yes gene_type:complete